MILRIDDFPSGIRPILKDLSIFFKIFDEFEKNEIYFYLGIVPELLKLYVSESDKQKLLSYKFLIPCQHGFEHRYNEFSEKLKEAKDPFNEKTFGTFDEFENKTREQITGEIQAGKQYLESFFNRKIEYYIPVCNIYDQKLVSIISGIGFKHIFTVPNKKVIGINNILTEKSIRLHELDSNKYQCICLHITWEYDYILKNGFDKWINLFDTYFKKKVTSNPISVSAPAPAKKQLNIIPKIANFYWNIETPLSYLRFLTIKSFRFHHSDWEMNIWVSSSNIKNVWTGQSEKQDFQNNSINVKNYLLECLKYNVNILQFNDINCKNLAPNYISDIARFKTIENGGWFFDLDQIFVSNFNELCHYDFVSGGFKNDMYCGVLGKSKKSVVSKIVNEKQLKKLKGSTTFKGYCELGNHFLNNYSLEQEYKDLVKKEIHFITDQSYFYPVGQSHEVPLIYNGKIKFKSLTNCKAVHWYGGHPISQEFNKKYTKEFAKKSNDSISVYLRETKII